jgi:hypothetical protein
MNFLVDDYDNIRIGRAILLAIVVIIVLPVSLAFYQSYREAKILNATFGTSYSTSDILWTGDTIKEIIQGKPIILN